MAKLKKKAYSYAAFLQYNKLRYLYSVSLCDRLENVCNLIIIQSKLNDYILLIIRENLPKGFTRHVIFERY